MKCVTPRDIANYVENQLSPSASATVGEHIRICAKCANQKETMESIISRLAPDHNEFEAPTFTEDVMTLLRLGQATDEKLSQHKIGRPWIWLSSAVATAAAAALVLLWINLPSSSETRLSHGAFQNNNSEFQARGAYKNSPNQWVSFKVFKQTPSRTDFNPVEQSIQVDDALAFTYENRTPKGPDYLMIFAVDRQSNIYWYYPAWLSENENPTAIPIDKTEIPVQLPEAVQHELHPGRLTIVGLFSNTPLTVRQVESAVQRKLATSQDPDALNQIDLPEKVIQTFDVDVYSRSDKMKTGQ